MSNDQISGRQTSDSADGSTSWNRSRHLALGETVRLDNSHVDGPPREGGRDEMVSID